MTATSTIQAVGAERAVTTGQRTGRRLRRRHLWLVPGLAMALYANQLGTANGAGILAMVAFGLAPDVPRLFGSHGRLAHNLFHHELPAIVAVAIGLTGLVPTIWLVGSLVWLGHVIVGRGIGDVPRRGGERAHA